MCVNGPLLEWDDTNLRSRLATGTFTRVSERPQRVPHQSKVIPTSLTGTDELKKAILSGITSIHPFNRWWCSAIFCGRAPFWRNKPDTVPSPSPVVEERNSWSHSMDLQQFMVRSTIWRMEDTWQLITHQESVLEMSCNWCQPAQSQSKSNTEKITFCRHWPPQALLQR